MKMMPLVKRGLPASRVVFGSMGLGGGWNRDPITQENIKEAEAAIDAALEIGITMFDHANIYTMGKAEQTFGAVFQNRPSLREQIILQSKCGIRLQEENLPGRFDFSKEHILEAVNASLQRLNTEYLDVLLLHRPDPLMEPEEIAEAFGQLKAAGKVRYFGVSNMSVGQIRFIQQAIPDSIAVNQLQMGLGHLHFLDQGIYVNQNAGTQVNFADGLMEYCQMENIQIQAWGPLDQGNFSGRDVSDQPEHIQKTAALVAQMADAKGTSREAIVLGWLMRHPAMIQAVIGTVNPSRIKACADAEHQAEQMTRDEWYMLYVSARGERMP